MRLRRLWLLGAALWSGLWPTSSPARASEEGITFAVLSDIHVQSWDRQAIRKFTNALEDMARWEPPPSAIVVNGDLGNGFPEDYRTLNGLLARMPHPEKIWYTIGNHEFYKAWHDSRRRWNKEGFPNGETEEASLARFLRQSGQERVYYEQTLGGYPFLFLGSERYRQSDPAYQEDAYVSAAQLRWLESRLTTLSATGDGPIFVFLHQPLPATVAGSDSRGVTEAQALRDMLRRFPQVILFTGHTHWRLGLPDTLVQDKFVMVGSSSVSQPWPGPEGVEALDRTASEGLQVSVTGRQVRIRGRDFTRRRWLPEVDYTVRYDAAAKPDPGDQNLDGLPQVEKYREQGGP